jgi:DNA repair protein RadD
MEAYPYQVRAIDAAIAWIRKNTLPCFLDLSMSSGKSFMSAKIADTYVKMTGNKALIMCPTSSLVTQNAKACTDIGANVSIYSASIDKSTIHSIVVCTPQTFVNDVEDITNGEFGLVIIDEGEGITKQILEIIDILKRKNPRLRVIGMSGTPYRTGEGYVAEIDVDDSIIEEAMPNPFYKKIVERVSPKELIQGGYAVPPKVIDTGIKFDTVSKSGSEFTQKDQDKAFLGQGRKTSAVVQHFIDYCNSVNARGVFIYASSIQHCNEILESMPHYNTGVIHGKNTDKQNKQIIDDFRARRIKYLINVNMATVGLSVDHVDVLCILRLTSSARLYQQILGRGMRLLRTGEIKDHFSVLDYTDNIKELFPSGDVFDPDIKSYGKRPNGSIDAICPDCGFSNKASLRPNPEEMPINENGYYMTLSGNVELIDGQPYPAHYTRRCGHMIRKGNDKYERCSYYWTCKECPECEHKNDIAARFCEACKVELIDPNEKLNMQFEEKKKDLTQIQTDEVIYIKKRKWTTKIGGEALKISIGTNDRIVEVIVSMRVQRNIYEKFLNDTEFNPKTVTYKKSSSGYFHIYDFNRPSDRQVFKEKGVIQ